MTCPWPAARQLFPGPLRGTRRHLPWIAFPLLWACSDADGASGSGGGGPGGGGDAGGEDAGPASGTGGEDADSGPGVGPGVGGWVADTSSGVSSGGGGEAAGGGAGGEGAGLPDGPACVANGREGVCIDVADCTVDGYAPVPGFCEGPAEIQCCAVIGEECDPDAHPLPNVGVVEPAGMGGCPGGMIAIDGFCIDRWEAFLVTWPDGAPVSPYFNPDGASMRAMSADGAVPQGYIDQVQAEDACLAAGKRLCEDEEWLRACGGPGETVFPYGDERDPGVCNDAREQHPAVEYFGTTEDWIWSELDHPCLGQLADGLARTGDHPGCETAEGALDMMGNLHEWTADPAGTFRGGFFVDTELNGPGCLYATTAHDVSHWDYSTGFRCCADLP
jgi:sulfatase modifying factor 1